MATPHPTEARYPQLAAKAGHYESFYLKLCHPVDPLGAWIRYTVHKRPGAAAKGSLWFTLFDRSADGTWVNDSPVAGPVQLRPGDWIRLGPDGPVLRFLGRAPDLTPLTTTA